MDTTIERIREVISALPSASKYYSYGTAGFRDKYTPSMHVVFVKVGILAALRSLNVNGQAIGVMITASHNAKEDNGVKIVDPDGGMLTQSWENTAEKLVNADVDGFIHGLIQFIAEKKIQLLSVSPLVIIGADCRDHSPILSEFVRKGVEIVLNGIYHHIGRSTTPLLHYVVAGVNQDTSFSVSNPFDATKYINAYFDDLYFGFTDLVKSADKVSSGTSALILDCAYGVGSVTTEQFLQHISSRGGLPNWEIQIRNRVGEGPVNENSGAEHCQKLQIPCHGVSAEQDHHQLLCSFDGDADRIVFHAFPEAQASSWTLLDGDRIASLIAQFLNAELLAAGLVDKIDVGIVQTAYANGSSTHFLKNNGIQIHITKTGVKYLHHKAHELDIGIYFEANGHGTVLFSKKYRDLLASESLKIGSEYADQPRKVLALKRLQVSITFLYS